MGCCVGRAAHLSLRAKDEHEERSPMVLLHPGLAPGEADGILKPGSIWTMCRGERWERYERKLQEISKDVCVFGLRWDMRRT